MCPKLEVKNFPPSSKGNGIEKGHFQISGPDKCTFAIRNDLNNYSPNPRVVQLFLAPLGLMKHKQPDNHGTNVPLVTPNEGEDMEPHQRKCREVCEHSARRGTGLFIGSGGCDRGRCDHHSHHGNGAHFVW